jgi:ribosomal protein S12 methylthiotransferase accessory factor
MSVSDLVFATDSVAAVAGVGDVLIDDRVGVVRSLVEVFPEAGAPNFFHFRATAANTAAFVRLENFGQTGGASARREVAAAKAIGEAVERYSSAVYDVEELPLCSYREAPFACTAPAEYALYRDEQYEEPGFSWVPFNEDTPVRWTPAVDLATGEPCHVPAARTYMPYFYFVGTGDSPIDQPISTGLACGIGVDAATRAAIGEVVERDAVLIVWQAMISPPQIRLETLSAHNYDLVKRFEAAENDVVMFDLSLDTGIPTILSVLRGRSPDAPALVVAAATSVDPEEAAEKSLEELALTRVYSHEMKTHAPPLVADPPQYTAVHDQRTHLHFWTDHAALPLADFLFASSARVDFDNITSLATGDPAGDVSVMVDRIRGVGERVLAADLTTDDVRELGFAVIRAVVPGFHPLHLGHPVRALGGRRLWNVPQQLGYPGIDPESGDNPAPHPYP